MSAQPCRSDPGPLQRLDRIVTGAGWIDPGISSYIQGLQDALGCTEPLTGQFAASLLKRAGQSVFLISGFVVPGRYPQGENDGPLGTLVLARALRRAGLMPTIWVDPQLLDNGRWLAAEIQADVPIRPLDPAGQAPIQETPAAAIAIEKPGENARGVLHTFDGIGVRSGSVPVDHLFRKWTQGGTETFGIGDRGNEIGFGVLHDTVRRLRPETASCECGCAGGVVSTTQTSHLLPAAVSNWGAYGVAAALSILTGDETLLLQPEEEARLLRVAAVRGCVDGIKKRGVFGVDGILGHVSVDVVRALFDVAQDALRPKEEDACA